MLPLRIEFRQFSFMLVTFATAVGAITSLPAADEMQWKAGVATADITPRESMWMAGYASRTKPSEGKVHDLHAKALALQDDAGDRVVIVTFDLIGIPRELRDFVVDRCGEKFKLTPAEIVLNASHTHCGPELRSSKARLQDLEPERAEQGERYLNELKETVVEIIGEAIDKLEPAKLAYTHGRAGFAMNRRLKTERGFENKPYPDGPVDHDVPVLRVDGADGKPRAVLFGYACHNTTLSFQQFCGDYAGFAQAFLEESHPGVTAMFFMGCGGDQNPQPRGTVEHAQQHGRALANGVEAGLLGPMRPVIGPLACTYGEAKLEFADPPTKAELEKLLESKDRFDQRRAAAYSNSSNKKVASTRAINIRFNSSASVTRSPF